MNDVLIGISGSYNNDGDQAPLKAADKYFSDIEAGRSLKTIPLYRGQTLGVDNLKFMLPIGGVPIIAYTILNAIDQTNNVRVVGSKDVGKLVDLMNDELGTSVTFVDEGEKLSLSNSLSKLFSQNSAGENYFVTGDIPFAKGYTSPGYSGDVVIDLNAKKLVAKLPNVTRNFYNTAKHKGYVQPFKEPNVFFFSGDGFDIFSGLSETFFKNRKGGGLTTAVIEYLKTDLAANFDSTFQYVSFMTTRGPLLAKEIIATSLQMAKIRGAPTINLDSANKILSKMFGMDFTISFDHNDVFRLLDIDGLNNDWALYEQIARNVESSGKTDKRISNLRKAINNNEDCFSLTSKVNQILPEYLKQINDYLPLEHHIQAQTSEDIVNQGNSKAAKELTDLLISQ